MSRFKIPVAPTSTVKSIRFPDEVIQSVEKVIRNHDCTFNAFVVEAVKNALDDLRIEDIKGF